MTPQSPRAMTPEERAIKILGIVRNPETINKNQIEMAAEQIKLAMEQAREEGLVRGFDKGFHNGQVAMRERAADRVEELAEGESNHFISEKVRALHPHAPEEE